MRILLASASPRRREILSGLGYEIETIRPDFDEGTVRCKEPSALVTALAEGKGRSVSPRSGALLVAADTVVVFQGEILGKPESEEAAFRTLKALSGKTHEVFTGVYLAKDGKERSFFERTEVTFRSLTDEEILAYIATGSPMDKAGAYGVQDSGFMDALNGSYDNVVGFPTEKFNEIIKEF